MRGSARHCWSRPTVLAVATTPSSRGNGPVAVSELSLIASASRAEGVREATTRGQIFTNAKPWPVIKITYRPITPSGKR